MDVLPMEPMRETEIAKLLNQNRKTLAELRFSVLQPDEWFREDSIMPEVFRPVWITPKGYEKLLNHFGLKQEEVEKEKKFSSANAEEVRTVIVKRMLHRNPYLIEVTDTDGSTRIMKVKDSTKWVVGMKCEVRSGGNYTKWLIPLRNPRYRGRF
jgi:hypothetical protein